MNQSTPSREMPRRGRWLSAFLRYYVAWILAAVPFVLHVSVAIRNVRAGYHIGVPEIREVMGEGVVTWLLTYAKLLASPETQVTMIWLYSLWALVLVGLSIHAALRAGERLMFGVSLFLGHAVGAGVFLAVLIPAVWVLFMGMGPAAREFVPPLVLLGISLWMERATRPEDLEAPGHSA